MKNFLILPLVLLSFCVFADGKIHLGTIGQVTVDSEDDGFGRSVESNMRGIGLNFYRFRDENYYLGASFASLSGDIDVCSDVGYVVPNDIDQACVSGDTSATSFGGEIGWNFEYYTPFIGINYYTGEIEVSNRSESDDEWSLDVGIWLTLDRFYLRGAMNSIEDGDSRSIAGGFLYQMDSDFVLSDFVFGATVEFLLDSDVDGMSFTLSFGKAF